MAAFILRSVNLLLLPPWGRQSCEEIAQKFHFRLRWKRRATFEWLEIEKSK